MVPVWIGLRETFNSSGCFSFCHFSNPSYLREDKRREAILQALFISRLTNSNCNNISPTSLADKTRLSARTIEKLRAHEDNASVSRGRERVLWRGTFPGILSACCFRNVSYNPPCISCDNGQKPWQPPASPAVPLSPIPQDFYLNSSCDRAGVISRF